MSCNHCQSNRVVSVRCKCSDCFHAKTETKEYSGYVLDDIGIGGGDYVDFSHCLDCGKIQGTFPLPPTSIEEENIEE